jgi:glycerol-3-phosphate cytidylyltransferase
MMHNRIVYTGGTFDLFHEGHVHFLWQCKRIAGEDGKVVVSLNTDEFIEEYKGKPPIIPYESRKAVLLGSKYVDSVIPNEGGKDSTPAILRIMPDFIVIGSDWAKKDYYAQMGFTQDWLDGYEIVLIYVPYTEGISSTQIKERLKEESIGRIRAGVSNGG